MPTLEWIGKNKVVNHHQEVPFRVLERQYSFDEQGQHTENNGSENMIMCMEKYRCFCAGSLNTSRNGLCYSESIYWCTSLSI